MAGSLALSVSPMILTANAPIIGQERKGVQLHQFASTGPLNHSSNSYFIETADGVFVIDAQWTLSEARKALAFLRTKTKKPLLGLLITHDHTDHYGGTPVFMEEAQGDLPIYASAITRLSIKNDAHGFQKNRKRNFGDDFPSLLPTPNQIVAHRQEIDLGSIKLNIIERPNNEATATTLVYAEGLDSLICGDIVYDQTYAIFRQGFSGLQNWIQQLEELKRDFDSTAVCPGHGRIRPGHDIVGEQIRFLSAFNNPVMDCLDKHGHITTSCRNSIKQYVTTAFPNHKSIIGLSKETVIDQSIDWLAAELDKDV